MPIPRLISALTNKYTMYNTAPVIVCFVELQAFTEEVLRVANDETLRQFEAELAKNPEAGDLIRHSGGLRKGRMKLPGRGKSGSARVIYLGLPEARRIVLFMLYTKAKQADIPPALLARLRDAVAMIKANYNR
jgi:mRNA-degrading endonuclease RelE of RelBE toxin-antitoxin system